MRRFALDPAPPCPERVGARGAMARDRVDGILTACPTRPHHEGAAAPLQAPVHLPVRARSCAGLRLGDEAGDRGPHALGLPAAGRCRRTRSAPGSRGWGSTSSPCPRRCGGWRTGRISRSMSAPTSAISQDCSPAGSAEVIAFEPNPQLYRFIAGQHRAVGRRGPGDARHPRQPRTLTARRFCTCPPTSRATTASRPSSRARTQSRTRSRPSAWMR